MKKLVSISLFLVFLYIPGFGQEKPNKPACYLKTWRQYNYVNLDLTDSLQMEEGSCKGITYTEFGDAYRQYTWASNVLTVYAESKIATLVRRTPLPVRRAKIRIKRKNQIPDSVIHQLAGFSNADSIQIIRSKNEGPFRINTYYLDDVTLTIKFRRSTDELEETVLTQVRKNALGQSEIHRTVMRMVQRNTDERLIPVLIDPANVINLKTLELQDEPELDPKHVLK